MKLKYVAALLLGASLCFGQAPRTIDFTQQIHGLDGKPINGGDGKTPMTLGEVSVNALQVGGQDDSKLSGVEKLKMYELAKKIYNNKNATLTAEQITMIKDRIAKYYATIVVGPAFEMLDPASLSK